MQKIAIFVALLFILFSIVSAETPTKESKKVKALIEKVNSRLDSIIQNQPYETIQGDKYYRFKEGVFTVQLDTMIIGAFSMIDRIHFTSHNGVILFTGINEKGKSFEKTLEQLLFSLENY